MPLAEQGDISAQINSGCIYKSGEGLKGFGNTEYGRIHVAQEMFGSVAEIKDFF